MLREMLVSCSHEVSHTHIQNDPYIHTCMHTHICSHRYIYMHIHTYIYMHIDSELGELCGGRPAMGIFAKNCL